MKKCFLLLSLMLLAIYGSWAQPDLPNIATLSQGGINVLSWINPYTSGVKQVSIERSNNKDSNYVQVGTFAETSKPSQFFTDVNPLPGENFYRVVVYYNSGLDWKSNVVSMTVDSAEAAARKAAPNKDSLEHLVEQLGVVAPEKAEEIKYTPSRYVYTNPYNGNINIELENPLEVGYKVIFYDDKDKEVLEVPRVNDDVVVLDKRNFQKLGLYTFRVFKENKEFAKGKVAVY